MSKIDMRLKTRRVARMRGGAVVEEVLETAPESIKETIQESLPPTALNAINKNIQAVMPNIGPNKNISKTNALALIETMKKDPMLASVVNLEAVKASVAAAAGGTRRRRIIQRGGMRLLQILFIIASNIYSSKSPASFFGHKLENIRLKNKPSFAAGVPVTNANKLLGKYKNVAAGFLKHNFKTNKEDANAILKGKALQKNIAKGFSGALPFGQALNRDFLYPGFSNYAIVNQGNQSAYLVPVPSGMLEEVD